jgi:hypothetical protein
VGAFYASPLADGGSQVSKLVSILRIAEWVSSTPQPPAPAPGPG